MIKGIFLKGVASYSAKNEIFIDTGKPVNLFYGQNGTGKSTIAHFLQDPTDARFSSCSLKYVADTIPEILVYNQKFVETNFLESGTQPGVFTLSKENKEAELAIVSAKAEMEVLGQKSAEMTEEINALSKSRTAVLDKLKETVWVVKSKYEHTPLDYCLEGLKSDKEKLLAYVKQTQFEDLQSPDDTQLKQEAGELKDQTNTVKQLVAPVTFDAPEVESSEIFQEIIVGSSESYLSQLIQLLGNSDWVQEGSRYLALEKVKCPFCQQKLPALFEQEVRQLFDKAYLDKIFSLSRLHELYKEKIDYLKQTLAGQSFKDEYVIEDASFSLVKERLLSALATNLEIVEKKIASPSSTFNLIDSKPLTTDLNERIHAIKARMETFNEKITNRKMHLGLVKSRFWKLVRYQYQQAISEADAKVNEINTAKAEKRNEVLALQDRIMEQGNIISECQKKITNIDRSIEHINRNLSNLGVEGFELRKEVENASFYRIVRAGQSSGVYKSLSEGEKTLITFLYFVELCQGSIKQDRPMIMSNRVIVIDDPISSLSHNYVFDVAAIIHHKLIETDFMQVFVLTHNLYFFHELLRLRGNRRERQQDYQLLRVTKNETSSVSTMTQNEIQNEYQSYWQVIKDAVAGKVSSIVIPNAMRNIIEYYFNFVHKKDSLSRALEALSAEDKEFKPFERYINRSSHTDAINITDFGKVDPAHYMAKFREIFVRTGFQEHYDKMMGV